MLSLKQLVDATKKIRTRNKHVSLSVLFQEIIILKEFMGMLISINGSTQFFCKYLHVLYMPFKKTYMHNVLSVSKENSLNSLEYLSQRVHYLQIHIILSIFKKKLFLR